MLWEKASECSENGAADRICHIWASQQEVYCTSQIETQSWKLLCGWGSELLSSFIKHIQKSSTFEVVKTLLILLILSGMCSDHWRTVATSAGLRLPACSYRCPRRPVPGNVISKTMAVEKAGVHTHTNVTRLDCINIPNTYNIVCIYIYIYVCDILSSYLYTYD